MVTSGKQGKNRENQPRERSRNKWETRGKIELTRRKLGKTGRKGETGGNIEKNVI